VFIGLLAICGSALCLFHIADADKTKLFLERKYEQAMGAARHGQEGALAPPPLEMRKWVFVTVTNCTLEYLNRQ